MLSRKGGSRFNEEKKGVKTDGIRREGPFSNQQANQVRDSAAD